jgi:hypothetical protein
MPTLSVEAVHESETWLADAVALTFAGTDGGVVSVFDPTITIADAVTDPLLLDAVKT